MAITMFTYKDDPVNPVDMSLQITVPDQAMSIQEILQRSLVGYDGLYEDSEDSIENIDEDFDLSTIDWDIPVERTSDFDLADVPDLVNSLTVDVEERSPVAKRGRKSKAKVKEEQDPDPVDDSDPVDDTDAD